MSINKHTINLILGRTQNPKIFTKRIINLLFLLSFIGLVLFSLTSAIKRLSANSGDASIYWTYAKSMWEFGPFYYGNAGTKHGATSPLWAILLSFLYPICGETFICYKLSSLIIWFIIPLATIRLSYYLTKSITGSLVAGALILLPTHLQLFAATGEDIPFFTLIVVISYYYSFRLTDRISTKEASRFEIAKWATLISLLPLARPEGLVFFVLFLGWTWFSLWKSQQLSRYNVIVILLSTTPSLVYYSMMAITTGQLIPSSVMGRLIRRSVGESHFQPMDWISIIDQCSGAIFLPEGSLSKILIWTHRILFIFGARRLWDLNRCHLVKLLLVPATICGLFLISNPSFYLTRYAASISPLGNILVAIGGVGILTSLSKTLKNLSSLINTLLRIVIAVMIIGYLAISIRRLYLDTWRYLRVQSYDSILDKEGSEILNNFLDPSDIALVYEIQSQYYLESRTISADGIVGGEILPYLRSGDLGSFVKDYQVTHILVSEAFKWRSIYDDTLLEKIYLLDDKVAVGEEITIDGISFKKITKRAKPYISHWHSVYQIEP